VRSAFALAADIEEEPYCKDEQDVSLIPVSGSDERAFAYRECMSESTYYLQHTSDFPLRSPIKLECARGEDAAYVLFAPAIEVGGVGDTFRGAVTDLTSTALHLLREYRDTPDECLDATANLCLARLRRFLG
jgi:hypothetical protein